MMARDDIEFTTTPIGQTPACATPGTPYAEDNSDGPFIVAVNTRLPDEEDFIQRQGFSLPPVDGGKDAWLFLAAVFVVDALIWGMCFLVFLLLQQLLWVKKLLIFCRTGFPFAFGVFQDYYSSHKPFAGQPNIAVIGTSAMGVMYLASPIIMGFCRTFGRWTRWFPILGLIVMSIALALSSFATTTTHLILSQGIFYGLGGGLTYCPCIMVSFILIPTISDTYVLRSTRADERFPFDS